MPSFSAVRGKFAYPYPRIFFFSVKAFQLLASCGVAGIMFYFIAHINSNKSSVPWMFYFLHGSALATIISNIIMGLWIYFRKWIPKISASVNAILAATWAAGFGLLVDAMKSTVTTPCTVAYWGNSRGIIVCSLYKALLAAGAVGLLSTTAMAVLDIMAARKLRHRRSTPVVNASLLAKLNETEYEPVWTGRAGRGLDPTDSDENPRFEAMRGDGSGY